MKLSKLLTDFGILTAIIGAAVYFAYFFGLFESFKELTWLTYLFFAVLTLVILLLTHLFYERKLLKEISSIFLAAIVVKLLASVSFIMIYFQNYKPEGISWVLPIFVMYFAYGIFEYYCLIKYGRSYRYKKESN